MKRMTTAIVAAALAVGGWLLVAPTAADFSLTANCPTVTGGPMPHAADDFLTSSPAVGGPFPAEDVGGPGPLIDIPAGMAGFFGNDVDAMSWEVWRMAVGQPLAIYFSVDPQSAGFPGSQVWIEANAFEAQGDVFEGRSYVYLVIPPGPAPLPLPFLPPSRPRWALGTNRWAPMPLMAPMIPGPPEAGGDHRLMSLQPTPPAPPGAACDDIDALDAVIMDGQLYSSVTAATGLPLPLGVWPADILVSPFGPFVMYAPAPSMGLDMIQGPGSDDIDGLVIFDNGNNVLDPGIDFALFSLRRGSASLMPPPMPGALSPADVFITNFAGGFDIFAYGTELGLQVDDELDGLTLGLPQGPPILSGDLDVDQDVDLSDFTIFQLCYGGSNNPPAPTCPPGVNADLDGDGDVDLADFLLFQQHYTGSL